MSQNLVLCPLRSRLMDRCVMSKIAAAKAYSFFTQLLLTSSISLHIRQAHHMDEDTMNNTHHYRGGWTGGKQKPCQKSKRKTKYRGRERERETTEGQEGSENRKLQQKRKRRKMTESENREASSSFLYEKPTEGVMRKLPGKVWRSEKVRGCQMFMTFIM